MTLRDYQYLGHRISYPSPPSDSFQYWLPLGVSSRMSFVVGLRDINVRAAWDIAS